jgi:hypothetical protein
MAEDIHGPNLIFVPGVGLQGCGDTVLRSLILMGSVKDCG